VNVFAIFCVMDSLGVAIRKDTNYDLVLIAGCLITVLLYFVLKYLKYKTNLLNEEGR
jgi:hypothetical protein